MVNNQQKKPFRDVLRKRCSKNMLQIYRRTTMPKCGTVEFEAMEMQSGFLGSTKFLWMQRS